MLLLADGISLAGRSLVIAISAIGIAVFVILFAVIVTTQLSVTAVRKCRESNPKPCMIEENCTP